MRVGMAAAWREVRAIVTGLAAVLAWGVWRRKPWLALLAGGLLGWVAYFFRDPERSPALLCPGAERDIILAPADGRVMAVDVVGDGRPGSDDAPPGWQGPARRIIIFLSLLDVHVQRSPYAGVVQQCLYRPGAFLPAYQKNAGANESNLVVLSTAHGLVGVRQVTGILARRIVCWVQPGAGLQAGQRLGLIRFGSRVDLLLPLDAVVQVRVGQQVYGGQTVVGEYRPRPNAGAA